MTTLAIAARELRERSRLFLICAALAVLPFLAGLLPGARPDRGGVITTASSYLALALAIGSAMVFGASTVMRDMVERRLSFYFSRPIPAYAIWVGKAAAALLSSCLCFAIIALPAALLVRGWPGPGMWMLTAPDLVGMTFLGVVGGFFVSHLVASVVRSRSVLIGIDFVLAAAVLGVLALLTRPLLTGYAMEVVRGMIAALATAFLAIAVIAPIFQLQYGRTDVRRSHAALSKFLWPAVWLVLGIAAAYVWWVVSVTPADLETIQYLEQSPRREQVVVSGLMRNRGDYRATFVIDGDGKSRRIGNGLWSEVRFSRDGSTFVWLEPVGVLPSPAMELHTSRAGATNIRVNGYAEMAVSDDGSRVAVGRGNLVAVYETATGNLLASAAGFDRSLRHTMFFVSNDVLRVLELSYGGPRPSPLRVFELDVAKKKLTKAAEQVVALGSWIAATSDGSRILLRRMRRVVDGRTLETLAELPQYEPMGSTLLGDGRAADVTRDGTQARLRIHGGPEVVLPIANATIVGELADGLVIVRGTRVIGWSATGKNRMMFVVDPKTGTIVRSIADVKGPDADWEDPRLRRFEAVRLAGVDAEGKLVWWDPRTGQVTKPAP